MTCQTTSKYTTFPSPELFLYTQSMFYIFHAKITNSADRQKAAAAIWRPDSPVSAWADTGGWPSHMPSPDTRAMAQKHTSREVPPITENKSLETKIREAHQRTASQAQQAIKRTARSPEP